MFGEYFSMNIIQVFMHAFVSDLVFSIKLIPWLLGLGLSMWALNWAIEKFH